mgnify:CR=1 FL=1
MSQDLQRVYELIEKARLIIAQSQHFPSVTPKASHVLADAQFIITQLEKGPRS